MYDTKEMTIMNVDEIGDRTVEECLKKWNRYTKTDPSGIGDMTAEECLKKWNRLSEPSMYL